MKQGQRYTPIDAQELGPKSAALLETELALLDKLCE